MKELYANTIEEGTWRYIDLFSFEVLKKKSVNTEKAKHISFCLRQAKEYYQSAKLSSSLTKPVILYYGMLNLVKALILLKDTSIIINVHLTKHGLARGDKKAKTLLSLSCKIGENNKSVFYRLLEIAGKDIINIPVNINGKAALQDHVIDYSNQKNKLGKSYKVSELIVLLPELFDLIIDATKLLPHTIPLPKFKLKQQTKDNKSIIHGELVFKHNRYSKIKNLIREFETKKDFKDWSFIEDQWDVFVYKQMRDLENISFPNIRETIFRENYALLTTKKFEFSEIVILFMLSFIFGDIARYNPYIWHRLMNVKIQESRIIEAFLDLVYTKFPLLILRELRNELIYFKSIS
jgi:hypothetical protein